MEESAYIELGSVATGSGSGVALAGDGDYVGAATSGEWWEIESRKQGLARYPWYQGKISRETAQTMLHGAEEGSFVVRVSEKHQGYTITALYINAEGVKRFSHIMALPDDSGARWRVADQKFEHIPAVIEYYSKNKYKGLFRLTKGVGHSDAPPVPNRSSVAADEMDAYSGHVYSMSLEDETDASPVPETAYPSLPSRKSDGADDDEDGYAVPSALLGKAGGGTSAVVDFDSEDMYLSIEEIIPTLDLGTEEALPANPKLWDRKQVLQFLKAEKLSAFRGVFYRNKIIGKALLKLKGSMFPPGRFKEEDIEALDNALFKLRMGGYQAS